MNTIPELTLCNLLLISPVPGPEELFGSAAFSPEPVGGHGTFPMSVLSEAGFCLTRASGVVEGVGHLRASLRDDSPVGVVFVEQSIFPGFERREIARMIHVIDPGVQIAFISNVPDNGQSGHAVVSQPLEAAEVLRVAVALSERWLSRRGAHAMESIQSEIAREVVRDEALVARPKKAPARFNIWPALHALALLILIPMVSGWFSGRGEPSIFTGNVLSGAQVRSEVPWAVLGKQKYAEVNSQWLTWYYDQFRTELAGGGYGIVHWDKNFTCTSFASRFASSAQIHYFVQSFHQSIPADSIAVGEYWYKPDGWSEGHALVAACTEKGLLFLDPQNGHFVKLSDEEIRSAYLKKFD